MKRFVAWFGLVVMVLFLVACGGSGKDSGINENGIANRILAKQGKNLNITYVAPQVGNEYWDGVLKGIEEGAQRNGVTLNSVAPGAQFDMVLVLDLLDAAIAAKVDGIIMGAYDAEAVIPGFQKAKEAGIPVVLVDGDSPASARAAFFGTSNRAAGEMAGKELAKLLNGTGEVAILTGALHGDTAINRMDGFKDGIAGTNIQIVATENTEYDPLIAVQKAEADLVAYPNLAGSFGVQVHDGPGMAKAAQEHGRKIITIGFDDTAEALNLIRQGALHGVLVQKTGVMGNLGMDCLVQVCQGNFPAQQVNDTGVTLVTLDNIDTYK
ncbi:LacI family transcriptional regulator [Spirochaetia bacterium]|nr:LacI family transcriptional regulator [Spirochaetia bacterium]